MLKSTTVNIWILDQSGIQIMEKCPKLEWLVLEPWLKNRTDYSLNHLISETVYKAHWAVPEFEWRPPLANQL